MYKRINKNNSDVRTTCLRLLSNGHDMVVYNGKPILIRVLLSKLA